MSGENAGQRSNRSARSRAQRLRAFAARLARDEGGFSGIYFAVVLSATLLVGAIAIDYARTVSEYSREQAALDAALLAAADRIGNPDEEGKLQQTAEAFFNANKGTASSAQIAPLDINLSEGEVSGSATASMPLMMRRSSGRETQSVTVRSKAIKGDGAAEVALVLDNSASMAGQPLTDLRAAAQELVNVLYGSATESGTIKVGVVPYAGAVNVGTQYKNSAWIDNGASGTLASYHQNNYAATGPTQSRFDMLTTMGKSWAGCVEARPAPYDVEDRPTVVGERDSAFVPTFAPDEPDGFENSYLDDFGGTCSPPPRTCLKYSPRGTCTKWQDEALTDDVLRTRQRQLCKYTTLVDEAKPGPNKHCEATPLTPLTGSKIAVTNALNAMAAAGKSNIAEGVMWGWRVLSPGEPFTEGADYDDTSVQKYMVILARGANAIEGLSNMNMSEYSTWGYAAELRLNPSSQQTTALRNSMNESTRAACRNATKEGIKVYSVGFGVQDPHTRSMLQYCASHPSMNFEPNSADDLLRVFNTIGRQMRQTRIAG